MKILMVHPHDLFNKLEPWTIRIKSLALEFARQGHQVRLCYFPMSAAPGFAPGFLGPVELCPLDRRLSPRAFLRNTKKLMAMAHGADIVHFQKSHHYAAVPAVVAAYIADKPLHYDWDDWEEKIFFESVRKGFKTSLIGYSFGVLEKTLPLLADTVSVASRKLRELVLKCGKDPQKIFSAPVGADLEKFRPDLDAGRIRGRYRIAGPLVLYVGQLHGGQYVDLFLRAANHILHVRPDTRFLVVGEGFLEEKLKDLANQLGIKDKVVFAGAVPHEEIPYYIASADVCVATFQDTDVTRCKSPLKIVEYMACGKPVVASNVGDVALMVGGVGLLVEPGDFKGIAEAVEKLLKREDLRREMGKLARLRVEKRYNWPQTAANILKAYRKAMGRN